MKLPLQAIFSHLYPDPNASLSAEDPAPPETVDAAEVKGPEAEADPAGDAEAADGELATLPTDRGLPSAPACSSPDLLAWSVLTAASRHFAALSPRGSVDSQVHVIVEEVRSGESRMVAFCIVEE